MPLMHGSHKAHRLEFRETQDNHAQFAYEKDYIKGKDITFAAGKKAKKPDR